MQTATVPVRGFTVTGITVFHGVDATQLIGWGSAVLGNTGLTALILVPRSSIVYVDKEPFDVGSLCGSVGDPAKLVIVSENGRSGRTLVGVEVPYCTLGVITKIRADRKRRYRYAAFSLGQYPCSLGNHATPAGALEALAKHVAVT